MRAERLFMFIGRKYFSYLHYLQSFSLVVSLHLRPFLLFLYPMLPFTYRSLKQFLKEHRSIQFELSICVWFNFPFHRFSPPTCGSTSNGMTRSSFGIMWVRQSSVKSVNLCCRSTQCDKERALGVQFERSLSKHQNTLYHLENFLNSRIDLKRLNYKPSDSDMTC